MDGGALNARRSVEEGRQKRIDAMNKRRARE
jgi:hypothetical protein